MTTQCSLTQYSLRDLVFYFLKLGTIGFGGPIALTGYMQRDLVEDKKWISEDEFKEGFALAQLAPGPLAAQLAIYIGWLKGRILGATLVAIAFVLPPFLMCIGLGILYVHFRELSWIQSSFYAIGAAVIGIIIFSAFTLVKKTVGRDYVLLSLWTVSALVTAWTGSESLWIFLLAGLINLFIKNGFPKATGLFSLSLPLWMVTGLKDPATTNTLKDILFFFSKSGAIVFGSGLAIVPFLYGGVVQEYQWLTEHQFIDAVAVAMITPGPIVITVAFIGYLAAGVAGSTLAAIGTFLPCYLFTVIPAPYFSKISKISQIRLVIDGVTAAAVGAIAGAAFILGKRSVFDLPTGLLAGASLYLNAKTKVPEPVIILGAGIIGIILQWYQSNF